MVAQTTTTDIFVKVVELSKGYYFCFECDSLKSLLKLQKDNNPQMKKRQIEVNRTFHKSVKFFIIFYLATNDNDIHIH